MNEYTNHAVTMQNGNRYRVCIHRGGHILGVWLQPKRPGYSGRALHIEGPTAKAVIAVARRQAEAKTDGTP